MASAANLQKTADDQIAEAKAKKGGQSILCTGFVDPSSYSRFRIKEDVLLHFEIDPVPDYLVDTDVVFTPKKKAGTGTGTGVKLNTVNSTTAGNLSKSETKLIGRAIKVPCGTGLTRKTKGGTKSIKSVTIRLPMSMSLTAICLWINTCFKSSTKKPGYFFTQAGARVNINSAFTEKSKLPNKKND
jgi:Tfp pilus assembly protein PilZ